MEYYLRETGPMHWIFDQHCENLCPVLEHQGISVHSAEYATVCLQLFMG